MKLAVQGNNGKLVLTADNLKLACHELGIPDDKHTLRRAARAFDLYYSDKVGHVNDHTFKVASQYNRERPYRVQIKQTLHLKAGHYAYCTCQDWMNYSGDQDLPDVNFWCKHSIAALVWLRKHSNGNGSKIANECGSNEAKALQDQMNGQLDSRNDNGNGAHKAPSQDNIDPLSKPFVESERLDEQQILTGEGGNAHYLACVTELKANIKKYTKKQRKQIAKLQEYVISYKGIMKLAEKHHITFETAIHDETHTVIAKGRCGTSERVSGKPINGNEVTAMELAKRNAARQLLPLTEIKAIEHKSKLNAEFDWQVAYAKCIELVGTKAILDCIIFDLVKDGRLRQDNPSHYNRTEWLIIYDACKQDASNDNNDGGDEPPSSDWQVKLREYKETAVNEIRFDWIRSDLEREGAISDGHPQNWQASDFESLHQACALDTSLFNRAFGDDWVIQKEHNWGGYEYSRRYRFWIVTKDTEELREKCFWCGKTKSQVSQLSDELIYWERYYIKTVVCSDCFETMTKQGLTQRFNELYHNGNDAVNTDGLPKPSEDFINQINNVLNKQEGNATPSERTLELPLTEEDFVRRCKEAVLSVDLDESVEANELPLESSVTDGRRRLQMDRKLRTWIVEPNGVKKPISCREICEQFESKQNPSIVTRLRAGIDDGADFSVVELDD